MPGPVSLSKSDARRAMVRHHFGPCESMVEAFERLRSVQFDPIAPVGCNHDLVLQARVPGYKVGDWQTITYEDRRLYDGWDKQASLVPVEGWPLRRFYFKKFRINFQRIFDQHPEAVEKILSEIRDRGPIRPSESDIKDRKGEWEGSWHGPNLAKQTLRALWHTGQVMTVGRHHGNHIYDLTERVLPEHLLAEPLLSDAESERGLVLERHRAVGFVRPSASYEMWSYMYAPERNAAISTLVQEGELTPVSIEGVKAHATPQFLTHLDSPSIEPRVVFVAPLDQLLWDRVLIGQLFNFDYIWEIYTPEAKRKWGYYVLPVLFGDELVARVEFYCRAGVLELKRWLFEPGDIAPEFFPELERTLRQFMGYCSAKKIKMERGIDPRVKEIAKSIRL